MSVGNKTKSAGAQAALTVQEVVLQKRERIATVRGLRRLIVRLLLIAVAGWVLFGYVFGVYVVAGMDMYPRLLDGDLVVTYRIRQELRTGDVVVYQIDGVRHFGRVVARSGDTVNFNLDGQLLVNGEAQQEEVFFPTTREGRPVPFPITLRKSQVFVLADNREQAKDGRDFGPLLDSQVEGTVMAVLRIRGI